LNGAAVRLAVIVAVAENGVIGRDNALPWHLPEDLRYFRRVTMGKPVIMGRRTFDSIGRPLPGRTNILISRNRQLRVEGAQVAASLDEALALAGDVALAAGCCEILVVGGSGVYASAIPRADRLYVTEVHGAFEGDAFLPAVAWGDWRESRRERHAACAEDSCDYSFVVYDRRLA
jgi:dihydrofolate reductase